MILSRARPCSCGCGCRAPKRPSSPGGSNETTGVCTFTSAGESDAACDRARLTMSERRYFWRRQCLNPFAFEDYETPAAIAVGGAADR